MIEAATPTFESVGASLFPGALDDNEIEQVGTLFTAQSPGRRLTLEHLQPIAPLLNSSGPIGSIAVQLLGHAARPVRALLLDKSPEANWRLGWHQDRTISVRERREVEGFGPWSVKAGQPHVQPPHDVTARMITLRVHVDSVNESNAPLQILPGSQMLGRLTTEAIDQLADEVSPLACTAAAGDVWAYRASIVHASAEQRFPGRRRVLQIDFSADELPGGLEWAVLLSD